MLSVVTLVRNRNRMLRDFLRGWSEQRVDDLEVVVVRAGGIEDPKDVAGQFRSLNVMQVSLDAALDDEAIAYSHARNAGARAAQGECLVFCDADTIPTAGTAARLHDALERVDGLLTGDIRYLPPEVDLTQPIEAIARVARRHPRRPSPPAPGEIDLTIRHEMVWGLCMALRSSTYADLGGFDESYLGYAGEDTDLARTVAQSGRPAGMVGGVTVLHQHHDSFEPPLHQLQATMRNARRYKSKWGTWPMGGWLDQFERIGVIDRRNDDIEVVRLPTDDEIEAHRCRLAAPFR